MSDLLQEIWKDIPGYEGYYQVSTEGKLRSLDRTIKTSPDWKERRVKGGSIKQRLNVRNGYPVVMLSKAALRETLYVHRIVLNAFTPNPQKKPQVNHINGVKSDNRLVNLEWATSGENLCHSYRVLGRNGRGEKSPRAKLTNKQVEFLRKDHDNGMSYADISDKYGISRTSISKIMRGISYKDGFVPKEKPKTVLEIILEQACKNGGYFTSLDAEHWIGSRYNGQLSSKVSATLSKFVKQGLLHRPTRGLFSLINLAQPRSKSWFIKNK